jgi:hypothetical protein
VLLEQLLWNETEMAGYFSISPSIEPVGEGVCYMHSLWDVDNILETSWINLDPPLYKATAVDDVGCKARVITVGTGCLVTLGHLFRTYVYACLAADRETILSEDEGSPIDEFMNRVNGTGGIPGWEFLSTDLTSATDTFDSKVCRALARGVANSSKDLLVRRKLLLLVDLDVSANAVISYPDGSTIVQVRGVLMGNPESWGILNLYNKFFTRLGESVVEANPGLSTSKRFSSWDIPELELACNMTCNPRRMPIGITKRCGDDQVSYAPRRVLTSYMDLITLSGAILSPGTNCISKNFATFTQSVIKFSGSVASWIDIVRIISLVDWVGRTRLPSRKDVPREWSRGTAYELSLRYFKGDEWALSVRKMLIVFGQYLYHDFLQKCYDLGAEPFLSASLGGLGFPHPKGFELSHVRSYVCRSVLYLLRDDQTPRAFFERQLLNVWALESLDTKTNKLSEHWSEVWLQPLFSSEHKLPDLNLIEDMVNSEKFFWFDLNQIRNFFGLNLPLNQLSGRVLLNVIKQLPGDLVPIGTIFKEFDSDIRAFNAYEKFNTTPVDRNPSASFQKRVDLFRKRVKKILSFPGVFDEVYSPSKGRKFTAEDLESRLRWTNSFIWVSRPGYRKMVKPWSVFPGGAELTERIRGSTFLPNTEFGSSGMFSFASGLNQIKFGTPHTPDFSFTAQFMK